MTNAETMLALGMDALEIYAGEIFDGKAVKSQIIERASCGFRSLRIDQIRPLDLSKTQAATILVSVLEDRDFRCQWQEEEREVDHQKFKFLELEIFW